MKFKTKLICRITKFNFTLLPNWTEAQLHMIPYFFYLIQIFQEFSCVHDDKAKLLKIKQASYHQASNKWLQKALLPRRCWVNPPSNIVHNKKTFVSEANLAQTGYFASAINWVLEALSSGRTGLSNSN